MEHKIATSIGQSKKLLELKLSSETADMYWLHDQENMDYLMVIDGEEDWDIDGLRTPAWSLPALLKLMPDRGRFTPNIGRFDGNYYCTYMDEDGENKEGFTSETEPLDAAFEMVCWLLENNYLNKE